MKRRTLSLIQLILLVGLLATLVIQDVISIQAQQIRPQITNIQMVVFPEINGSKLMEGIISSTSTAIC